MPRARKELVSVEDTPYYHVISRCVRRAFLCGDDQYTGENFDHRKPWFQQRLNDLVLVFSIGLCSYAVMSNHYHLVVKIDDKAVEGWTDREVALRWSRLFTLPDEVSRWLRYDISVSGHPDCSEISKTPNFEIAQVTEKIQLYRERLSDLGWFMRCLNEYIARRANTEDGVTGRFWEGRYRSIALLDEEALLSAMAYVDLNPIRADIASTPEQSEYTSVQDRIYQRDIPKLVAFDSFPDDDNCLSRERLPFTLPEYIDLVDWTGRRIRQGKRGLIPENLPPILDRLGLSQDAWLKEMQPSRHRKGCAKGSLENLQSFCARIGQQWLWGMGSRLKNSPG